MSDVTIRNRTGTLQRGRAEMKRSAAEDEKKSLMDQVDSEKGGEQVEEWRHPQQPEVPKNDGYWAKNVQEGLSDIMRRLDQIVIHRNHLPAIVPNLPSSLEHSTGSYST